MHSCAPKINIVSNRVGTLELWGTKRKLPGSTRDKSTNKQHE